MSQQNSVFSVDEATPLLGAETVNLVCGSSFVVCSRDGWIRPGGLHGYFSGDSRVLSTLRLYVDGHPPTALADEVGDQHVAVVSVVGDPARPRLLIRHLLVLSELLTLEVEVENLGTTAMHTLLELTATADFADIFEVKRGERAREGFVGSGPSQGDLVLSFESGEFRRGMRISSDRNHHVLRDGMQVALELPARSTSRVTFTLLPEAGRYERLNEREVEYITPSIRLPDAYDTAGERLRCIFERSAQDIDSLRMIDPLQPERPVIAAGSPWFLALFGRDSLITALETIDLDGQIALNVLEALARRQGRAVVPETDEEPGRILHEVRSGEAVRKVGGWGSTYYGTVDATPLFIMTLAAVHRRGVDDDRVRELLPAAERCLDWVDRYGDADGDGLIEFPGRAQGVGLDNQAWKDSHDAVRHRDGSLAIGPIAMVEVQGYLHRALLDLAQLREDFATGDGESLRKRATELQERIHELFWMPDEECFAMALDGRKQQVGGVATNAGHLLWTRTAYEEQGRALGRRMLAEDLFSGFGLRTLSSLNPGYNPMSYHCGSIWPHDTALVAAGMFEYGMPEGARTIAEALLDAADEETGRLPELFGGFARERFPRPIPYPASCSPQAWAAAAPLLLARFLS